MLTKSQKTLYLLGCLNQHYQIFKSGATVLDCAIWLNCSKPTAQKYLSELFMLDFVRVQNSGNRRLFFANRELTVDEYHANYLPSRKELKGF